MRVLFSVAAGILLVAWSSGCGPSAPENEYDSLQQTMQEAENRLKAIGKVEKKQYPPGAAWSINLEKATIDDQVVADINTVERISELFLSGSNITDEQLQALLESTRTTYLNVVDVSNTSITDAGLEGLAAKRYLQKLNITGSKVTEGAVTALQSKRQANAEIGQQFKKVEVTK